MRKTSSATSGPTPSSPARSGEPHGPAIDQPKRRPNYDRRAQQALFTQLIGGGFLFLFLLLGAFYLGYLRPRAKFNAGAVRPILVAYMEAGKAADSLNAHRLFSEDGMRSMSREDLDAAFDDRSLFDGYNDLQVTSFTHLPAGTVVANDVARVSGVVTYGDQAPATLEAEMELDNEAWRLRSITLSRAGP